MIGLKADGSHLFSSPCGVMERGTEKEGECVVLKLSEISKSPPRMKLRMLRRHDGGLMALILILGF